MIEIHEQLNSDNLLPDIFEHISRIRLSEMSGEHELVYSVLKDGVECALRASFSRQKKRIRDEAIEWIFTDDYRWPFSFENCCLHLHIDPGYIRRGVSLILKDREQKMKIVLPSLLENE